VDDKIRTCNFGIRTEIKRTIVVFGWVGTVGPHILPDFPGEIEVVDHVWRNCTVVQFIGGGVVPSLARVDKTIDVGRVDLDIAATVVVSHVARGGGGVGRATIPLWILGI